MTRFAETFHGPLDLPTADGLPNVTHPSVFYVPGGLHGWRYWMAYTPYPSDARENPHIAVSNDGITWTVPDGLTNPIAPLSEAQDDGYSYHSDTEILLLADGQTLRTYYRCGGNNQESIRFRDSADGIDWGGVGGFTEVITTLNRGDVLSPAIVLEDDGTYTMWTIKYSGSAQNIIERRTSPDCATWSAPTQVTIPEWHAAAQPWHLSVIRTEAGYSMLLNTRPALTFDDLRLAWLESDDGLSWEGPAEPVVPWGGSVPPSPHAFETAGHYRGTILQTSVFPPAYDVWYCGLEETSLSGSWLIALRRNFISPVWTKFITVRPVADVRFGGASQLPSAVLRATA